MYDIIGEFGSIVVASAVIIGLLEVFLGYKIFRVFVVIFGFVFGFSITYLIDSLTNPYSDGSAVMSEGIFMGIFIACLSFFLVKVGVFIYNGIQAALIIWVVGNLIPRADSGWIFSFTLAGFVMAGALAVAIMRPYLIVESSFSGAFFVMDAMYLMGIVSQELSIFFGVLLAIVGIIVQFATTTDPKEEERINNYVGSGTLRDASNGSQAKPEAVSQNIGEHPMIQDTAVAEKNEDSQAKRLQEVPVQNHVNTGNTGLPKVALSYESAKGTGSYVSAQSREVFCTNCGRKISAENKFCKYCGTKIVIP